MAESEVARIRRQIQREYEVSHHVFSSFTLTARHAFITKRQENIAQYFQDLRAYMTEEEALRIIIAAENGLNGEGHAFI